MRLYGRRRIFTDKSDINETNIEDVIASALKKHIQNAEEIEYLRWYVRGDQPILERQKKVRKDVCNNVVLNLAQECLDFKLGYIWGEPVGIVRRAGSEQNSGVETYNMYLNEQCKDDIDQDIANDLCICGLGYRTVLNNPESLDESPFAMAKLDPETTFCVYSNDVFKRKMLGVSFCVHSDKTVTYTAYTPTRRFELVSAGNMNGPKLVSTTYNGLGFIPIVEYAAPDMAGIFERAVPLLDCINVLTSNRIDDIAQFVASILWIHNADMTDEDLRRIDELLAVRTSSSGDGQQAILKYLSTPLDQTSVQSLEQCLEEHVYELCGVPGRVQSSGGSTGEAASLGEAGWKKIEFQAKRLESAWKRGERDMIKETLAIIHMTSSVPADVANLQASDFDIKFVRSRTNNLLTKTQGMMNMINAGIHPRIAIRESDLFSDPEQVYQDSKDYIEMAIQRLGGSSQPKETGDVTNQPKGDESMNQAFDAKSYVQKRD